MRLIGMLDSPYVRRVAVSMDLMGIAFAHEPLSVFRDYAAFAAINPVVKAPTLVTANGTVLMESGLILDHLETLAPPERRLTPDDPAARLACRRAIGLALAACEKSVQIVYERKLRPAEKQHRPWLDRLEGQLRAALGLLEAGTAGGEGRLSQAGVTTAVTWTFARNMLPDLVAAADYPALQSAADHAEAQPAFLARPFD